MRHRRGQYLHDPPTRLGKQHVAHRLLARAYPPADEDIVADAPANARDRLGDLPRREPAAYAERDERRVSVKEIDRADGAPEFLGRKPPCRYRLANRKELGLVVAQLELQRIVVDIAVDRGYHFLRHADPVVVALLPKRPPLARQLVEVLRAEALERTYRPPERNERLLQPRAKMELQMDMVRHDNEVEETDARRLLHLGQPALDGKPERSSPKPGVDDFPEQPPTRVCDDCNEQRRSPGVVIPVKPPVLANLLLFFQPHNQPLFFLLFQLPALTRPTTSACSCPDGSACAAYPIPPP